MADDVWAERLLREFESIEEYLPQNIELIEHDMDPESKGCLAFFRCSIKQPIEIITNQKTLMKQFNRNANGQLVFILEFDFGIDTNYPFSPPTIRVVEGSELMPKSVYSKGFLHLQYVDQWTSEHTILTTISYLLLTIQQALQDETETLVPNTIVPIATIYGACFPCCVINEAHSPLNRSLIVTKNQVIQLGIVEDDTKHALVVSVHQLLSLAKLNFRRNETIKLLFEDQSKLSFWMPESLACVYIIKDTLKQHGIEEKGLPSDYINRITKGTELMDVVKQYIAKFDESPNVRIVNKIMNLTRQATEQFAAADDVHYQKVLEVVHEFLKRVDVLKKLERSAFDEQQLNLKILEPSTTGDSKDNISEIKFKKLQLENLENSEGGIANNSNDSNDNDDLDNDDNDDDDDDDDNDDNDDDDNDDDDDSKDIANEPEDVNDSKSSNGNFNEQEQII